MMSIKDGPKNNIVFIKLGEMSNTMRYYIRQSLFEIGRSNVRWAKRLFAAPKSGIKYRNLPNRSSAPGEPPANQSGKTSRHINFIVRGSSQLEFGDESQPGRAPIGLFLERGTVKMKPRPHISRTIKDEYKNTQNSLIRYVKRGMSK